MSYPEKAGQPCWAPSQVAKVISLTAHTTAQSAAVFLAAHSPFHRIHDGKAPGRALNEEEVFSEIFGGARGEVQAFIKGDPGTGKSHLIRWLCLRSEYAAEKKQGALQNYKLVLVRRGNGSLKDALKQIVDQLGPEFRKHSQRVQGAIEKLSDGTARAKLISELALEVDQRWAERGREPIPRDLRHLGQALRSSGFGGWLQRDGSTVAQIVRMLTESSSAEEREQSPQFAPADFQIPTKFLGQHLGKANNSQEVVALAEDLQEDDELAKKAAEILNTALRHAIGELTDLRGSDLLQIFTEIRRSLRAKEKDLAIFIEDVSTTPGLFDQEVVQAFEPNPGDDLCRMVAILGITVAGWARMQENRTQRATHIYEVGGDVVKKWASDPQDVARFTARYLNAVRLTDQETTTIAEERFRGDIRRSKCDSCRVRVECHAAFGAVELDTGATIGMFPFTATAPQALLQALVDNRYRSQRGLLDRVLMPAVGQSDAAFAEGAFPRQALFNVQPKALSFWSVFEGKYCGGARWDEQQKGRLKFLAQFWATGKTVDEVASQLQPILAPLGLPDFITGAKPLPAKPAAEKKTDSRPPAAEDPELLKLLTLLDDWKSGKPLREDSRFRELLGKFLKQSVRWQDQREIPVRVALDLVDGGARYPRIEAQQSKVAGQLFFIEFPRDAETYDLLEALVKFNRAGEEWAFEHAEVHKRAISRWLRKHESRIFKLIKPAPKDPAPAALNAAVGVLSLAAVIRDHQDLPELGAAALNRVLEAVWAEEMRPPSASSDLLGLLEDLERRHGGLIEFVVQELGVGQGLSTNASDFINPLPILKAMDAFKKAAVITPPPDYVKENFWKTRFLAVSKLGEYGDLKQVVSAEREKIASIVESSSKFIEEAGFPKADIGKALSACLKQLTEVIDLQSKHDVLPLPVGDDFERLREERILQDRKDLWAAALDVAQQLARKSSAIEVLSFNSNPLLEMSTTLATIEKYLELVERELKKAEATLTGGASDTCDAVLSELSAIATLGANEEKRR
jgi:hypothetical protein